MGDVRYAKFRVGDLLGPAKLGKYHNPKDLYFDASGYRYICASNVNNGVNKQMPSVNGSNLNVIGPRIIAWGKQCPMFTYHDVECVTSQGMYYYDVSALNERASLYVIGALTACVANSHYGYSNCLIGKVADELIIELPVTLADVPDWDYMAEYIAELEAERIAELEAYLVATGLDDCELTDEDRAVLGRDVEAKEFRVGKLFEKLECAYYGKGARYSDISDVRSDEYPIPVTSAKSGNNGVCRWAREGQFETYSNVISVVYNGAIAAGLAYYQPNVVSALADSYLVCLKNDKLDETLGLYLVSALQKVTKAKYSRENKAVWKRVSEDCISLPVTSSGTPDWDYMRAYIRAQEKLVMAGVADMTQARIDATREIVGYVSDGM